MADPEIPRDVIDNLERRGHKVVRPPPLARPASQVIVLRDGLLEAASDPRKGGAPAAP
jgi:gamma-glutamyltranspeptidase